MTRSILFTIIVLSTTAAMAVPLVPPGVRKGEPYRLLFVTEGSRDATATDIAEYDAFVQAEADRSPLTAGAEWLVIGSTAEVDFRDRVDVTFPWHYTYLTNGWRFTGGIFEPMGQGRSLDNFPTRDQFGGIYEGIVFTGTSWDGSGTGTDVLGAARGLATSGFTNVRDGGGWISYGDPAGGAPAFSEFPFYALSEPIVAPYEGVQPVGDWHYDGVVDQRDLDLVLLNWGTSSTRVPGWFGPLGPIDQRMLDGVLLNWGTGELHPVAIPEPAAWVLVLVAIGACGVARRRAGPKTAAAIVA